MCGTKNNQRFAARAGMHSPRMRYVLCLGSREVLKKVGDLAVKKSWSDQNLSEFSKVNLIGQILHQDPLENWRDGTASLPLATCLS